MNTSLPIGVLEPSLATPVAPRWLTVSSNLDPRLGGVSAVMPHLIESVRRAGQLDMSLAAFCTEGEEISSATAQVDNHERYALTGLRGLGDRRTRTRLERQIAGADGVHIHGLWQEHCALAARVARASGKPYVLSAHGMLDPWALRQKRWKKTAYFHLIEKNSLRGAACLHALTAAEAEAYAHFAPGIPVAVIPNGIGEPPDAEPTLFLDQFPELAGKRLVLFLARIHPKKGLDLLCQAWRGIAARFPDAHLVLAGPDSEGYRQVIEDRVAALGIRSSVLLPGMLTGPMKWSALRAAQVFVLPSYSEGLSVSVLEALSVALPVVITEQCHIAGVREQQCGWQIQPRAEEVECALGECLAMGPEMAAAMGARGRALVRRAYHWSSVGRQMAQVYRWVSGGPVPADVTLLR